MSTSCDLTPCNEDVVVEICDLIAKENDELKQEVERLREDLRWLKDKGIKGKSNHLKTTPPRV